MNKYALVGLLLLGSVVLDIGTKTLAEDRLASHTRDYQHFLHIDVPDGAAGQTVGELLEAELAWNSPEEIVDIANRATYLVNDSGEVLERARHASALSGGERLEVQQRAITLVEGFLVLRYVENRGAAWGFLNNQDASFTQPFFIVVGILAIIVIFFFVRSTAPDRRFLLIGLGFIVGGAVGNIVDRIRYGYVVDFIDWHPGFEWPTFNVADALIVVGVGMLFIEVVRDTIRQRRAARGKAGHAAS